MGEQQTAPMCCSKSLMKMVHSVEIMLKTAHFLGMTFRALYGNIYNKTCLKRPFKIDKTKISKTNGSLMKVKSIAECYSWSILQYF